MTIYILIPVYNESQNINALHENLMSSLTNEENFYIFVDDKSTDNTVEKLRSTFQGKNHHIIEKTKNQGPGHSFNIGFEWIIDHSKNDNDIIITMEADNTSDTGILHDMYTISKLGYDLVLASVYAQGGGFEKTTLFRKIISFMVNMLFRSIYNIKVLTLSSFYRIYHISLIEKIKANYPVIISEKGFICMLEILMKAIKQQAKIIEVPMILKWKNRKGKSKMKIIETTISYLRFLLFKKL